MSDGGEQLDLLRFSLDARAAGHRIPVLDVPLDHIPSSRTAPAWAEDGLPAAWWAFHRAHPEVELALCQYARKLRARGHVRLGIAMLWEHLRYETLLGSNPEEPGWRLPNNHRAYYARWIMEQHDDLDGIFVTHESEAERLELEEEN